MQPGEHVLAPLAEAGLTRDDVAYLATPGEAESLEFATGHFYSMTAHARGKVLGYRMTSQGASGSGQFLENIARYLGITQEEIGALSLTADDPEKVSSICAVLAETDVINMVSRRITAPNILKGIHLSMATRLIKLLRAAKVTEGDVLLTGGLALDVGLFAAIEEAIAEQKLEAAPRNHPDSIYAGAIGAAIWGAFRYDKLAGLGQLPKAS